jgi:hypothetical protein
MEIGHAPREDRLGMSPWRDELETAQVVALRSTGPADLFADQGQRSGRHVQVIFDGSI